MEINALTAVVGGLGTLIGILINVSRFSKDRDNSLRSSASEQAVINTKLDNICGGVDSLRVDFKVEQKERAMLAEKVIRVEESTSSAHKRIGKLEERVNEN